MNAARKQIRCAIYARISQDDSGQGLGVARQIDDATALAESRGWTVVETFTDNDVSAYSGAKRPGYIALMDAVEAGQVDRIVVYMTSRLWRSRRERAAAVEVLAARNVGVVAVSGPELDLSTASGRMVAGILGEFDTMESAVKSERVARAAEQRAERGLPSGGLGFGWRKAEGGWVVDEEDAKVVREIVRRLTAGESLRAVTGWLNDSGIPAPGATHRRQYRRPGNEGGAAWGESSVRKIALRPSNAALRVHRGQIVGKAAWPAIITEDEHREIVAVLTDPTRRKNGGDAVRRHLLSFGIGRCGVCGSRLRVAKKGGNSLYVCDARSGCVGRREDRVDAEVEKVVIERLSRPDALDVLASTHARGGVDATALVRVEEIRRRLDDAASLFAAGSITAEQLATITSTLRPDLEEAEAASSVATTSRRSADVLAAFTGRKSPATVWASLDVLARREVLAAVGLVVEILPTRQGPGFDPQSLRFSWTAS